MKQFYLSISDIKKILSRYPQERTYNNLSYKEVEDIIKEYYNKPFHNEERKITLHCLNQAAVDLFHEAMKKEAEKYILNGESS